MTTSWKTTVFGLLAAAGGAVLGAYQLKPELLAGFPSWVPGLALLASAIGTACMGLAARDNNVTSEQAGAGGRTQVPAALVLALLLGGSAALIGCASLAPGADPLVVRVEQTETMGQTAMDLVVKVEAANLGFWRTNAPGFVTFAEWLKQPQTVDGTYGTYGTNVTLPRGLALVWSLDQVKQAYEAGRAGSNDVVTAMTALAAATTQAQSWLMVTTNAAAPAAR
nr:hypothetical protein [uncultured Rhodopila sp.]